jgi:hypothetical protein
MKKRFIGPWPRQVNRFFVLWIHFYQKKGTDLLDDLRMKALTPEIYFPFTSLMKLPNDNNPKITAAP